MGSLFGGGPKAPPLPPPPPPPPPPAPMPDPEDVQGIAQRRRKAAAQSNRSGRLSTMLSEAGGETLG